MKLGSDIWAKSIVGARENQQDSFRLLLEEELGQDQETLVVLADGMGGHTGGAEASRIVVDTFARSYRHAGGEGRLRERLRRALDAANAGVRDAVAQNEKLRGMGSTLAAVLVRPERVIWASVGDSPIWLWHRGQLRRLNEDHSLRSELDGLVEAGRLTAAEAARHPQRNALRSAVCGEPLQLVDVGVGELSDGDIVLLASDGVQTLSEAEVAAILSRHESESAADLVERCLREVELGRAPHQDNATLVICKYSAMSLGAKLSRAIPLGVVYGALAGLIVIGAGIGGYAWLTPPRAPEAPAASSDDGRGGVVDPEGQVESAAQEGVEWHPVEPADSDPDPLPETPPDAAAAPVEEPPPAAAEEPPPAGAKPAPQPKPKPLDDDAVAPGDSPAADPEDVAPARAQKPPPDEQAPAAGPESADAEPGGAREGADAGAEDQQPLEVETEAPEGSGSEATGTSELDPVHALIDSNQLPNREVTAYALVAIPSKTEPTTRKRYLDICAAFFSTLAPLQPASEDPERSLITYWPIREGEVATPTAAECEHLVDRYDFYTGLRAIINAGPLGDGLAQKRGPFLVAWAPSSAGEKHVAAVVMDLSGSEDQAHFRDAFACWRAKVMENGASWRDRSSHLGELSPAPCKFVDRHGEDVGKPPKPE